MQQINLYLPEFRPSNEPLRSAHMLWAVLALIVLLAAFSVFSSARNKQLHQQLATEKQSMESLQLELQKLMSAQGRNQPMQLDTEIEQLQRNIARRKQILALISSQDLGNADGFSIQIIGLARQSLDAVSLESFSFQRGGSYVELAGKTHQPDQVPLYLHRLRNEAGFTKARFGVLNVEREADDSRALSFQVAKPTNNEGKK